MCAGRLYTFVVNLLTPAWVFNNPVYHLIEKTVLPKEHAFICPCGDKKESK